MQASTEVVVSMSRRLQPVMVAQVSLVCVAVVFVEPWITVVPKERVVRHSDASAGVQSAGFGGGPISPPGNTLKYLVRQFTMLGPEAQRTSTHVI